MTADSRLVPSLAKGFKNNPGPCQTPGKTPFGPSPVILIAVLFATIVCLTDSLLAQQSVGLTWAASTSSVMGYNVYRGNQTGGQSEEPG